MIERSRVRIPAGTAGEFSSPGSTFCADSYFGIRSTPVHSAACTECTHHSVTCISKNTTSREHWGDRQTDRQTETQKEREGGGGGGETDRQR